MEYLLTSAIIAFIYMSAIFIIAILLKDNSIVDIAWGGGFIILTTAAAIVAGIQNLKQLLTIAVVFLWGMRLSVYIFLRNRGKGEDFRYAAWRKIWKWFYLRSFLQVFMLQGFVMLIVAWPVLHILYRGAEVRTGVIDAAGLLIFVCGFCIELISDRQMKLFSANPVNKGKLITTGLWKYSRHPNYFGEALLWWGIWLLAVSVTDGLYTIAGPLLITLLLRYVSGVPMLEKKLEARDGWHEYKAQTPVFIPFFPKGRT
ncbi:MAG TPA: DUF1295 domain-containing protein [Lentimicrobium sp.]|nr:DUF1295 domain-containing protein [Lentimicrobium sp.]